MNKTLRNLIGLLLCSVGTLASFSAVVSHGGLIPLLFLALNIFGLYASIKGLRRLVRI